MNNQKANIKSWDNCNKLFLCLGKLDQVLQEMEKAENLVNQVLYRTFQNQKGCDQAVLHTRPMVPTRHVFFFHDFHRLVVI